MNNMKYFIFLICFTGLIIGCKQNNETAKKVLGNWQAVSWTVPQLSKENNTENVRFEFNTDKTYSAQLGSHSEKGKWYISMGLLYTQAEGLAEIATKIKKVQNDSLVLELNRGGILEELTLIKK